ncbi:hypothetical protein F4820DRAFT_459902 [Hypoxylon rubiginosum]|uniref:Uncharacterized protein n=1 Tax=Hypoxylon rubiginosum TaxID=110542 RepID=A0ACB9YUM4_9PEZI|nr:hypothetical protein F4820DRAFT_459902 [Hypoxylon rubiginosum]
MVSSETYRAIQNWIGQQLEYEATHSAPAPLTDAQRKLLDKLEQALPLATPLLPEPDLGDTNWIGLLMEDRAARQRGPGNTAGVDFQEKPGPVVSGVQNWYCQVRIDEYPEPFPNSEGGILQDGMPPCFVRKKDAKKYAAKCAVEWLRTKGQRPATPQPSSPERKKQKLSASSPEQSKNPTSEPDVLQEVQQLCVRLGSPDRPKYIITENPEQPGFFSGYPDMGILVSTLPAGVGRVEDVLGKRPAKEKIAEELLVHLRSIVAKHDEEYERYIETLPPVKKQESENNHQPSGHLRG